MYRRIWLTIPLCCWPFPQLCGFPILQVDQGDPCPTFSKFGLPPESARLNLAGLLSRPGSSPGLCFPTAQVRSKGPPSDGFPRPSMFRLQGLLTLMTAFSL
jgi:hypothetical protein